jgi:hypothetical protein
MRKKNKIQLLIDEQLGPLGNFGKPLVTGILLAALAIF